MKWRKWVAAVAIGVSVFGVAACDDGNQDDIEEEIKDEADLGS